jgi:hypothetical protein
VSKSNWFCIVTLNDWLTTLAPLFDPSEVKPRPIAIHSQTFSRALRQLHVFTSSFDWLIGFSVCFVITLVLVLPRSIENLFNFVLFA